MLLDMSVLISFMGSERNTIVPFTMRHFHTFYYANNSIVVNQMKRKISLSLMCKEISKTIPIVCIICMHILHSHCGKTYMYVELFSNNFLIVAFMTEK